MAAKNPEGLAVDDRRRDVLYLMGDVSFGGGAHIATKRLIKALCARGYSVDVLVQKPPTPQQEREWAPVRIYTIDDQPGFFGRVVRGILARLRVPLMPDWIRDPRKRIRTLMKEYKCVCVMSECSPYRLLVARLPRTIRKVQLSHMDYLGWREKTRTGRAQTALDGLAFRGVDVIALVGEANARKFRAAFPAYAAKTAWFRNIIPVPEVSRTPRTHGGPVRLVTVARLDAEQKDALRLVRVARYLKDAGACFHWTVYGEGPKAAEARELARKLDCTDVLDLAGWTDAPFEKITQADLLVLPSHYEGLPNVIYESFMCGTPVFATDVGALADQIEDGRNGWLVPDDEAAIEARLADLLKNSQEIAAARDRLRGYTYDNKAVIRQHENILGLRGKKDAIDPTREKVTV